MYYIDLKNKTRQRYNLAKFMEHNGEVYDDTTSYFMEEVQKLSNVGSYVIESAESRPDIYSRDIYGDTAHWQLILHYNKIINIEHLTLGTVLLYPALTDVETLYFRLKALSK